MMAKRIAQFHKVSFEQFAEGFQDTFGEMKEGELKEIYQSIKLPKRATAGSAGYDFYTPIPIVRTRENSKDSDWNPRGDAGKLGVKMLPEKRTWI